MKNRKFDFRTAYIDLLINLLTGIVVLFILTTLLIAPITKNTEGIKKNADYVLTLEWPNDIDCDIDFWIRDPLNNVVSYRFLEAGLMYFERDDMGKRRSVYELDGKEIVIDPDNKEFVTLRGTFPGEYVVNIHLYSCINTATKLALPADYKVDVPVIIEIVRINPSFIVIKHIEMKMDTVWQEKTAIRFVMNDKKSIIRFKNDYVSVRTDKGKG
ncbi:MAG: hypothetical protein [Caudoviricetes sp.]|nr:MAG: hypothetical protein [Caudoviricetes sp.]